MDPKLAVALEGLRDIHLPAPVSIWPLAPGWWALAAAILGLAAVIYLAIRVRRRRHWSLRALALRELAALETCVSVETERAALAIGLTTLLRRVALGSAAQAAAQDPPTAQDIASLHGERWIAFLTQGRSDAACSPRVARELVHSAYAGDRAAGAGDPREWVDFTRAWIREVAA
jgi:hypothetical protein